MQTSEDWLQDIVQPKGEAESGGESETQQDYQVIKYLLCSLSSDHCLPEANSLFLLRPDSVSLEGRSVSFRCSDQ